MARGTRSHRTQAYLQEHPWALSLVSAVFVLAIVVLAADAGWDLRADIGGSRRHAPLWFVLLLGLPLFGAGVVMGVVQQVRLLIHRSAAPAAPGADGTPSDDLRRLRSEGPGWLSRRGEVGDDDPPSAA